MLTSPVLADFDRQLDVVDARATTLVDGLSDRQVHWQPGRKRWSILQCLEHIAVSAELYAASMDRAIARGRPARPTELTAARDLLPLYGPFSRFLVTGVEPPPRVRVKTGRAFVPHAQASVDNVLARYLAAHQGVRARLRAAEEIDLVRTYMSHPSLRVVRFSLGAGFGILTGHARRHLWQADQVRSDPRFPESTAAGALREESSR